MENSLTDAEARSVLAWLRRRSTRNALRRALRNRAVQGMIAFYGFLAAVGVIAAHGLFVGPLPPLASVGARTSDATFVALFVVLYGSVFVPIMGYNAIRQDPIYVVDAVYTAPIAARTVLQERLRFSAFGLVVASVILGLLGGDLLAHVLGVDLGLTIVGLTGTFALWFWLVTALTIAVGFALEQYPARRRRAVLATILLPYFAVVLLGLLGATGAVVDPVTVAVAAFGHAFILALFAIPFGLPLSAAAAFLLGVLIALAIGTTGWILARPVYFYQSDGSTEAGLGLTVERAPSVGFWAELRRRLRPSYRDVGSGAAALRGLNRTILARTRFVWTVGFLAGVFGVIGAGSWIFELESHAALPPFNPAVESPIVFIGFMLMSLVAVFTIRLGGSIGAESWRLLPIAPQSIVDEALRPIVLPAAALAVGTGLFYTSLGIPPIPTSILTATLLVFGLTISLAGIRASWASAPPSTEGGTAGSALASALPLTTGVFLFNIVYVTLGVAAAPAGSGQDVSLLILLAIDGALWMVARRWAVNAGAIPPT